MEVLQSHQWAHEVTLFNSSLLGVRNNPPLAVQVPAARSRNPRKAPMPGFVAHAADHAEMYVMARLW